MNTNEPDAIAARLEEDRAATARTIVERDAVAQEVRAETIRAMLDVDRIGATIETIYGRGAVGSPLWALFRRWAGCGADLGDKRRAHDALRPVSASNGAPSEIVMESAQHARAMVLALRREFRSALDALRNGTARPDLPTHRGGSTAPLLDDDE